MVPSSIKKNLAGLRRRERLLTFVWGAACWLAVGLVLLLLCGLVDWLIDRQRDTPMGVRLGMVVVQAVVSTIGVLLFIFWPQIRRLPDTLLALWVEEKIPQFEHRLISAVQFNQPRAKLDGMSKELVGVVTGEADKLTRRVGSFAQVADHRRLKWTGFVLGPVVVLFLLPFAIWPDVCFALLARQALLPVEVPHSVELQNASVEVWPIGEEKIKLRYRVTGKYAEDMIGSVTVAPEASFFKSWNRHSDEYPLTFITEDENGAIFGADINPASVNIAYSARLADGRTKLPSVLRLVARPVIADNKAWVRLPAYCGLRPGRPGLSTDDRRYEKPQGKGDVAGIVGSTVRVQFEVDSPRHKAWIVLLGPEKSAVKRTEEEGPAPEKEIRKIDMQIKKAKKLATEDGVEMLVDVDVAEARFDLGEGLTGYRMMVQDENGFDNVPPLRRSVKIVPEDAPTVTLLRDSFSDSSEIADFDVAGLPVVIGRSIRIPYACFDEYGLGKARILYRVLKKQDSEKEPVEEDDWIKVPLAPDFGDNHSGEFDTRTGVFQNTPFDKPVLFHAIPSPNPEVILGAVRGGGRYFLDTKGLLDRKTGKALQLKSGDLIEYCVEVYAANHDNLRKPNSVVPVARSETRVTEVKTLEEFNAWRLDVLREDERVKDLYAKQKAVPGEK